jgi:hypothetical protein
MKTEGILDILVVALIVVALWAFDKWCDERLTKQQRIEQEQHYIRTQEM